MPSEITMPQLTDTMTEGTVVKWRKKEGEKVKAGEIVAEVETDKAVMEMEVADGGTLAAIVVAEGGKAPVGALLGLLAKASEKVEDVKKMAGAKATAPAAQPVAAAPAAAPEKQAAVTPSQLVATLVAASRGEIHEPSDVGHGPHRETPTAIPPISVRGNGNDGRILVSPLARRVAAEWQIDLSQVKGTGPNGRIVQNDVLNFTAPVPTNAAEAPAVAPAAPGSTQVIPMTKMRTVIASALQKSKQTVPHFYVTVDIDVERITALRERLNLQLEKEQVRLSLADFIIKSVAAALVRHPILNARFNAEKNEITRYADVNLGIAVSIPDGLIVPVLRAANTMGLREIRARSTDLIERARAQRLRQGEQGTGTFTISSLGTFGVREFGAIINPPEVAILAVGAAERRAIIRGDQIVARQTMTMTLSADHRVVDGAVGAEFLRTLKNLMEEPGMLLV